MSELENNQETAHIPVIQQLLVLGVIMLLIFGTGYAPKLLAVLEPETDQPAIVIEYTEEAIATPTEPAIDHFADMDITGSSAFVWDVSAKRALWQKNPDEQLPLASITKLMTALLAYELFEEQTTISVTLAAITQEGSSGFVDGETFDLQSLSDLMLVSSSNDGAYAIAESVGALLSENGSADTFISAMNIRAEELDLTQMEFYNPTGLDISPQRPGAVGSARDVTFLMEHILREAPTVLEATTKQSSAIYNEDGSYHDIANTNIALQDIPNLLGSKTGYTELAGGNLVVAFDSDLNRPIIVVVLNSTRSARFADVLALTEAARLTIE